MPLQKMKSQNLLLFVLFFMITVTHTNRSIHHGIFAGIQGGIIHILYTRPVFYFINIYIIMIYKLH